MAKFYLIFWCFVSVSVLSISTTSAQTYPVYYQFFSNPYFYNPSFAGSNDYSELNLLYRKQWSGLEDAPEVNGFSLQHPTGKNISLGFNFFTEKSVVMKSSAGLFTFAYKVRVTPNSYLKFGISGGLGVTTLDLEEIANSGTDIGGDPVLANAIGTTYALKGNFGVHYKIKNFTLGFALPNLFTSNENDSVAVNSIGFSHLSDQVYTLSYKAPLGTQFSIEPYLLYRKINEVQDQKEASVLVYFKDQFWAGGGYRLDSGPMMTAGMVIKDFVRIGYSYEIPTSQDALSNYGSHEIQLRVRLGKHKASKVATKPKEAVEETETVAEEEPVIKEEEPEVKEKEKEKEAVVVQQVTPKEEPAKKPVEEKSTAPPAKKKLTETGQLAPGIYVVIGAFKSRENADKYSEEALRAGYPSQIGLGKKGLYYVYVYSSIYLESSRKMRDHIRQIRELDFRKAWILEIE